VRLRDSIEAEDSDGHDIELTRRGILRDLLQRHVREWESPGAEHQAAEEGQVDAAGHLQQRIEVRNRIQAAKPAGKTGAIAAAQHGEGIGNDAVADHAEHSIDLIHLGYML
jgi:hypothetical protein